MITGTRTASMCFISIALSGLWAPAFGYEWIWNPVTGSEYSLTMGGIDGTGKYYGISDGCPNPDFTYEVRCSTTTWIDAESEAESQGGHLVVIEDEAENAWLVETFGSEELWIGLTDHDAFASESTWVWVTGDPLGAGFQDWGCPEPNDAYGGEDCGQINLTTPCGHWNDLGNPASYPEGVEHGIPLRGIIERPTRIVNCCLADGCQELRESACVDLGGYEVIDCMECEATALERTHWGTVKILFSPQGEAR